MYAAVVPSEKIESHEVYRKRKFFPRFYFVVGQNRRNLNREKHAYTEGNPRKFSVTVGGNGSSLTGNEEIGKKETMVRPVPLHIYTGI